MHSFQKQFLYACRDGKLTVAQQLLSEHPDIDISYPDEGRCCYDCFHVAFQYPVKHDDSAFRAACTDGRLEVAQWLLQVKPTIDVSVHDHYAFRHACRNYQLDVAHWTSRANDGVFVSEDERAFRHASQIRYLNVAQWLQTLKPHLYKIYYNDDGTFLWYYIRTKEQQMWLQKRYPLWLASDETPCKQNLFYKMPPDVARYVIQRYL